MTETDSETDEAKMDRDPSAKTDSEESVEESAEPITFAEIVEFANGQMDRELENVDGDVPDHGVELIVTNASKLLQTQTALEFEVVQDEQVEEFQIRDEEDRKRDLEDGVVEILLAVAALIRERDLDVESAFRERRDFTENFNAFQDAASDAETQEEVREAADKHLEEEVEGMEFGGGGAIEPGDNVDREDYDAEDDRDRHIA